MQERVAHIKQNEAQFAKRKALFASLEQNVLNCQNRTKVMQEKADEGLMMIKTLTKPLLSLYGKISTPEIVDKLRSVLV